MAKGTKPEKAGGKPPEKGAGKQAEKPVEKTAAPPAEPVIPRLRTYYQAEVVPALMKRFGYRNRMQVPRLEKIVVNMGVGDAIQNIKFLDAAVADLAIITGQKAAVRRAKKSIANFKLREGAAIGAKVTLRGPRMYEFYDRLITFAIPRIRDFRGLPTKSFDGRGNYTLGVTEQIIFHEINYDKVEKIRGMDITFVTSARTDEEGRELLKLMGLPFREK
jgi:large subunit ribosomal protein L5